MRQTVVFSVVVLIATFCLTVGSVHSKAIDSFSLFKLFTPVYENCYSHDGVNVNKKHVTWGRTGESLPRLTKAAYTDGVKDPPRLTLSARVISNAFSKQTTCDESNDFNDSSMIYAYGQFVDHDISNEGAGLKFTETLNIEVPPGDVWTTALPFTRAVFASDKPTYVNEPVNQVNFVTGYMDCSQIYGSDEIRADALREKVGGFLKADVQYGKEFLPKSFVDPKSGLFFIGTVNNSVIAGDNRATEALPISIMQTLMLREHNRLAKLVASRFGVSQQQLSNSRADEWIYQTARTINCAQIQHITYKEYLPRILGKFAPKPKDLCYDEEVKTTVTTEFATAAFRFGHSTVGCDMKRFTGNGSELAPIDFGNAFNAYPVLTQSAEELDNLLRGLIKHHAQNLDEKVVDGLRQVIRGRLDLVARNIQRGRDVGLPDYNTIRTTLGFPALNVTQITSRADVQAKLISFWGVNLVGLEPWLGILLEQKVENSQLGELGTHLLKTQFENFVKGDNCFYSHNPQTWARSLFKKEIEKVTLADIIDANTGVKKGEKSMGTSPFVAKYGPLV